MFTSWSGAPQGMFQAVCEIRVVTDHSHVVFPSMTKYSGGQLKTVKTHGLHLQAPTQLTRLLLLVKCL